MGLLHALLLAGAVYTVTDDGVPLRAGCDPSERIVARLQRGERVEIRFALAGDGGACYKVAVEAGGRNLEGYLPASAVRGIEEFERSRQAAPALDTLQAPRQEAAASTLVEKASRLLRDNQPEEALRHLESALGANRRDAGLLAMAGLAAYQSDQVRAAIHYWQESLALAPNPPVERLLKQAEREAGADTSSEKLYGARFLLRYDPREVSAEQARGIVPLLDSEFARVAEQLGCRAEERIVTVIQSREAYLKTTGAAEWSGGRYDGRIRVALLEPQPAEETRRAFSHEIVHACLARTGNWPAWLHEGLAQKLSGERLGPEQWAAVRAMARSNDLPSLSRLGHTWSRMSARHAQLAYAASLAAAELLYEAYGPEGARSLLASPERLPQITAELDRRLRQER